MVEDCVASFNYFPIRQAIGLVVCRLPLVRLWAMKRRLRFFQFRLRTLFLAMMLAGPLSVWCEPRVREWLTPPDPDDAYLEFDYAVDQEAFGSDMPQIIPTFRDSENPPRRVVTSSNGK